MRRTAAQRKKSDLEQNSARLTAQSSIIKGGIVGGNYRIIEKIGAGGMGIVLKVAHVVIGTEYALKLLTPDQINESSWLRFQSEARTMASLTHPTFVKVYDLGLHNNQLPFYAMDLLTGITLEKAIIKRGYLSLRETISIFLKVLDGLAYAHRNGIIHRDLKPSNFWLSKSSKDYDDLSDADVKILDFGIAKVGSKDGLPAQSLTSTGEVFGSPAYMSPEQCLSGTVDARSDIYSIGCSIFESLTGFLPFDAESPAEMTIMQQTLPAPLMGQVAPERTFNKGIEAVVKKCLEKSPDDRYQSAQELTADLLRVREGKEIRNSHGPLLPANNKIRRPIKHKENSSPPTKETIGPIEFHQSNQLLLAFLAVTVLFGIISITALTIITDKAPDNGRVPSTNATAAAPTSPSMKEESHPDQQPLKAGYIPSIPASIDDYGTFCFSPEMNLGSVYTLQPFETFNLRGSIELPLTRQLTLRPAGLLIKNPQYLSALSPLQIQSISLSKGQAEDEVDSSQTFTNTNLAKFCSRIGNTFKIQEVSISDVGSEAYGLLRKLPNLKVLHIQSTDLRTFTDPEDLDFLRLHLKELTIRQAIDQTGFLEELAGGQLQNLSLEAEIIGNRTVHTFSAFQNLQNLKISAQHLDDDTLTHLLSLPALKELDINYHPQQIIHLCANLKTNKTLKVLTLRGITQIPPLLKEQELANKALKITVVPTSRFKKLNQSNET